MKFRKIYYSFSLVLLVMIVLISSVEKVAFSKDFYQNKYKELNTAESMSMSEDDLNKATDVLLDYIKGTVSTVDLKVKVNNETVEMFNEKEKDHMVDVKNLFQNVVNAKRVMIVLVVAAVILYSRKKDYENARLSKDVVKTAGFMMLLFFGGIIFFALIDFNAFWTQFHKVFFSNDLWLLDPRTDRMINMFPEAFFSAMVIRIITHFIVTTALVSLIAYTANSILLKRKQNI